MGECNCPALKVDSDGMCLDRCSTGLRGKYQDFCYTDCPSDSYRFFDWGQTGANQEYSVYDNTSSSDCSDYSYHLRFNKDGKGLPVSGPLAMKELPTEYTITLWLRPIGSFVSYGRESFIVRLFDVISLTVTTANQIRLAIGDSGVTISPTYSSPNDLIDTTQWNYIAISVETTKSATNAQLHIVLSISQGRNGTLVKAGEGTINMPTFNEFVNIIYLGAQNDTATNSFDGYLKELIMFNKYHSFDQLVVDKLKNYKRFAYDDPNVIAHWSLDEPYNSSSTFYTIRDYSLSNTSVTVYLSTNPDHPIFINDSVIALNLCYFHDVADCLTVDKSDGKLAAYVFGAWRYSYPPALNIDSSSITITNGDELHFAPKIDCLNPEAKLFRKYGRWNEDQFTPEPTDYLKDGTHYYLCYFSSVYGATFPIAQIYNAFIVDKISPVELESFRTTGVTESWKFEGGDQAFGDTILFSANCDSPLNTDLRINRLSTGVYSPVVINNFAAHISLYFCFRSALTDPTDLSFEPIRFLEYKIVERPQINTLNQYTLTMNYDTRPMQFNGPMGDYDYLTLSWEGNPWADCNPINFLNEVGYMYQQGNLPYIWYGYESGIHGMNSSSNELHVCWKSSARGAPDNWIRLKSSIGSSFVMRILEYDNITKQELPELESFDPPYGSTIATENTTEIRFNFHSEEVYPAEHATHGTGILRIFRGAVRDDGTIGKASAAAVLWEDTNLNDTAANDKFKQGDVECSLAGKCIVHLSGASKLSPGEIYYLSFYPYSFKNSDGYYLFGDTATVGVPLYEHMFQCRSFDIYNSDQVINGNSFNMSGANLISIDAYAKFNGNDILNAKFETKALKMALRITNSTSCSSSLVPSGSIKVDSMTETSFSVINLDLLN